MRLRLGIWLELTIHFGSQDRASLLPDNYLVRATVRCGTSQWYHGPGSPTPSGGHASSSVPVSRPQLSYTEPESMSPRILWR